MADNKNSSVMEMMLKKKEQERKDLQRDNEVLHKRIHELEHSYSLCQQTKDELAKDLFQAEDKIDELQELLEKSTSIEQLDEYKNKYEASERRYNDLLQKTRDDEAANYELIEQLKQTQELSSGKDKVVKDLNQQLAKFGLHVSNYQKENKRLCEVLEENKQHISNVRLEKEALVEEIDVLLEQMEALHMRKSNEDDKTKDCTESMEKLKEQTNLLIEERTREKEELKQMKVEVNDCKYELNHGKGELKLMEEEIAKCKSIINDKDSQVKKGIEENQNLHKEVKNMLKELNTHKIELQEVEMQSDQYKTEIKEHFNLLKKDQDKLEEDLMEEKEKYAAVLSEKEELEMKGTALESNLNELRLKIEENEMQIHEKESNEQEMDEMINDLQGENISIKKICEETRMRLEEANYKIKELNQCHVKDLDGSKAVEELIERLNEKIDKLEEENAEKVEIEQTLRQIIQKLKKENNVRKKKLDSYEQHLKIMQERNILLDGEIKQKGERETFLKEELQKKLHDIEELTADYRKLVRVNKDYEERIEGGLSSEERLQLEAQLVKLEEENKNTRLEVEEYELKIRELIKGKEHAIKSSEDLIEKLKQRTLSLEKDVSTLRAEYKKLSQDYNELSEEMVQLESTNEIMNEELERSSEREKQNKEDVDKMAQGKDMLENEANERAEIARNVENDLIMLSKRVTVLQIELDKERNQKKRLSQDVDFSVAKVKKLLKEVQDLKDIISRKDKEAIECQAMEVKLLEDNASLENHLTEAKMELKKKEALYEEACNQLNKSNIKGKELEEKMQELSLNNDNLSEDSSGLLKELKSQAYGIATKEAELAAMNEEKKAMENLLKTAEEMAIKLEEELQTIRKDKEDTETKLEDLVNSHIHKSYFDEKNRLLEEQIITNNELMQEVKHQREYVKRIEPERKKFKEELEEKDSLYERLSNDSNIQIKNLKKELNVLEENVSNLNDERSQSEAIIETKKTEISKLQNCLHDLEGETNEAKQNYEKVKQKYDQLKDKQADTETQLVEEKQLRLKLNSDYLELKRQFAALKGIEAKGKESRKDLSQEIEQLASKFEISNKRIEELEVELNTSKNYVSQLEVDRNIKEQYEEEISHMKEKILKISSLLEVELGKNKMLQMNINSKDIRIGELQAQVKNTFDSELRIKEMVTKTEQNYVSKEAYDNLRRDLEQLSETENIRTNELDACKAEVMELKTELSSLKTCESNLRKKVEKLTTDIEAKQFHSQQTNADLEKNIKRLNDCKQDYERQSGLVSRLQDELRESRKNVAGLQSTIDGLSEGNLDLDSEVKDWSTKCSRLRIQIEELQSDNMTLHQKSLEEARQNNNLKNLNERLERKKVSLTQDVNMLTEMVEDESARSRNLAKQVNDLSNEKKYQENCITELERDKAEIQEQNQAQDKEISKLFEELNAFKSQCKLQNIEIEDKTMKIDELCAELNGTKDEIKELEETVESLKLDLRNNHELSDEIASDLRSQTSLVKTLEKENASLQKKSENYLKNNQSVSEVLRDTKNELHNITEKYTMTSNSFESLKGEHCQTKEDLHCAIALNRNITRENEEFQREIEHIKDKRKMLHEKLQKIEAENDGLKSNLLLKEKLINDAERSLEKASTKTIEISASNEQQIAALMEENNQLQVANEKLCSEKEQFESACSMEQKKKDMLEKEIKQLKDETADIESLLREKKFAIQSTEEQLETKIQRIAQQSGVIEEKNDLILSLQCKVTDSMKMKEHLENEIRVIKDDKKKVLKENSELANNLQRSKQKLAELESELNDSKQIILQMNDKRENIEARVLAMDTDNMIFRQERDNALTDNENLRLQLQNIKRMHEQKKQELDCKEQESSSLKGKLTLLENSYRNKDMKIKQLQDKFEEKLEENASLKSDILSIKKNYKVQNERLEQITAEKEHTEKGKEIAMNDFMLCSSDLELLKRDFKELACDYDELKNQLRLSNDKLHTCTIECKLTGESLQASKKQLSRLQKDVDNTTKELERVKLEKLQAEEKLDQLQKKTLAEVTGQYSEVIRLKAEVDCLKEEIAKTDETKSQSNNDAFFAESASAESILEIEQLKEQNNELQKNEVMLKSELKFIQSKLASSSKEREKWEEAIKGVVSELEREKTRTHVREKELTSVQARFQREKEFNLKKINNFQQEIEKSKINNAQQLASVGKTHSIELETKRLEIDSLKRLLSLNTSESKGSSQELQDLRQQLMEKNREILKKQNQLKESDTKRQKEISILKVDLQCAKIELQLAIEKKPLHDDNNDNDNKGEFMEEKDIEERKRRIKELHEMLQQLHNQSKRMKEELKSVDVSFDLDL
eukprot:gene18306-20129_t